MIVHLTSMGCAVKHTHSFNALARAGFRGACTARLSAGAQVARIVRAVAALDLNELGDGEQLQFLLDGQSIVVVALDSCSISGRSSLHVDAELGRLCPVHREVVLSFGLGAAVVADGAIAVLCSAEVHV